MHYKNRLLENRLEDLFQYYPIVAVLGARQVGKSTLVETLFRDRVKTVVFDPVVDVAGAREDPDFFLQNNPPPVFLDEIQYAPELLASLKRKSDQEKRNSLYILSGSQNLAVIRNISESLAGRVAISDLLPMCRRELMEEAERASFLEEWLNTEDPDLQAWTSFSSEPVFPRIWRGGYPKVAELPDHLVPGYWESYLQTYIERDVRTIANIGSLQTFGRFIGLLAAHSAQEINHTHLGRELGVDRKTALAWTEIGQSTFQWISFPAFSRNPVKRIAGKEKGYFTDTGFLCYLQRIGSSDAIASHPLTGQLFETYVVMEILKSFQGWAMAPNVYHFRAYSGAEVDIILEMNGKLFPIEIKATSKPTRHDAAGFASLRACFPSESIHKGLVICAVENPRHLSEDALAVPWWIL